MTIGLTLLLGGLLLRIAARFPLAAGPTLMPAYPGSSIPREPSRVATAPVRRPIDYGVYVPGVGRFGSIDEAEQKALDRRWARAGARFKGLREERRES